MLPYLQKPEKVYQLFKKMSYFQGILSDRDAQ